MGNTRYAFVFPGQGSQTVGMAADLMPVSPLLERIITRAEQLTGEDIADAMLHGPHERLTETVPTQLSVFALSVSLAEVLGEQGVRPQAVAGHSLGEYSALVAGGWLDVDDALTVVARRSEAMRDCCGATEGAMSAVLGMSPEALEGLAAAGRGDAVVANLNSPRQSVISGTAEAVARLGETALAHGASAVIPLSVHGAFHSPVMEPAQQRLAPLIDGVRLRRGDVPLISSISGDVVDDPEVYRRDLARQITSAVRWAPVMGRLREQGGQILEVGPGKVLRGLFRHLDRRMPVTGCASRAECLALTGQGAGTEQPVLGSAAA